MGTWNEATLYQDSPFFGIGMSGWHRREWWEHREERDEDFGWSAANLYLLEVVELWW